MVTFHYYDPFEFTHQGAPWISSSNAWLGRTWGTDADKAAVRNDFDTVAEWASQHGVKLFLGEFGTYNAVPSDLRVLWTKFIREQAELLAELMVENETLKLP